MDQFTQEFAIDLAHNAGEIMKSHFRSNVATEWKADNSPVTVADTAINSMVIEAITQQFPNHAVIGEEESYGDGETAEWTWVCDPIDGTGPFSSSYPTFAFSLGLCHFGESVMGVAYDPMQNRLVTALKGEGTLCNGDPVHIADRTSFHKTLVDLEVPSKLLDGHTLRRAIREGGSYPLTLGSIVYAGLLTSMGDLGAVVYGHTFPWDGCALDIIIREAGGVMTDFAGEPLRFNGMINGFVAGAPGLHAILLELIQKEIANQ